MTFFYRTLLWIDLTKEFCMAVNFSFFHSVHSTVWKYSLNEKIFREINSFSFSNFFSKNVTFTKFLSKKWDRISAVSTLCTLQCGNYRNSLSHSFDKNFVKATTELVSRKLIWAGENLSFFHTVHSVEIMKINCRTFLAKISWYRVTQIKVCYFKWL